MQCRARGKPSTWFPCEELVEQKKHGFSENVLAMSRKCHFLVKCCRDITFLKHQHLQSTRPFMDIILIIEFEFSKFTPT